MDAKVGEIVIAGYSVSEAEELARQNKKVVLGSGLRLESHDSVKATKCGMLCKRKNIYYVDAYQKRYLPSKNDSVIGIVQSKTTDFFWVDINTSEPACKFFSLIYHLSIMFFYNFIALPYLAFEGATKKNRPDINNGDLVFCKVVLANPGKKLALIAKHLIIIYFKIRFRARIGLCRLNRQERKFG